MDAPKRTLPFPARRRGRALAFGMAYGVMAIAVLLAWGDVGIFGEFPLVSATYVAVLVLGGAATGLLFQRRWTDHLAAWLFVQPVLALRMWVATTEYCLPQVGMYGGGCIARPWQEALPSVLLIEAVGLTVASLLVFAAWWWARRSER